MKKESLAFFWMRTLLVKVSPYLRQGHAALNSITPSPLFPDRSEFLPAYPLPSGQESVPEEQAQPTEATGTTDAVELSSRTLTAATYRQHASVLSDGATADVADPPHSAPPPPPEPAPTGTRSAPQSAPQSHGTAGAQPAGEQENSSSAPEELTEEEAAEVTKLKDRDREVRAHEHAHLAAAGPYARGGVQYEYQRGPDGRRYAVGGEVSIDTSEEKEPEDTIRKAQVVRRAAQAPAEPSPQDRRVAAEAARMESRARQELSQERMEESREAGEEEAAATGESDEAGESTAAGATEATTAGSVQTEDGGTTADVDLPEADGAGAADFDVDTGSAAVGTFDGAGDGAGQILDLIA